MNMPHYSAQHTIGLLVENRSGVLAKIANLIAAKGYNIDSLSVGETDDASMSRMTIVLRGDDAVIEQACKQLNRLIDVIKVNNLTDSKRVERELVLLRVVAENDDRAEMLRIAEIFRANVVDVSPASFTMELTGDAEKIDAFIAMFQPQQIEELSRTGRVAMTRAKRSNSLKQARRAANL